MASPDWIGITIGAVIGIYGIYLALRRGKYPGRLVFIRRQSIALLNSPATRLPNLTLLYKDAPIGKSVVLISGYIANEGSVDLTPADVELPLTCELPGGCTWLEFTVTSASPELNVKATPQSSTAIALEFGQFRRDESFAFQALAQMDDEHSKRHASTFTAFLKWRHRIAGVGDVRQTEIEPLVIEPRAWKVIKIVGGIFLAVFMALLALEKFGMLLPMRPAIAFEYSEKGATAIYDVEPARLGASTLTSVSDGTKIKIDLDAVLKANGLKPVQVVPKREMREYFGGSLFLLFAVAIAAGTFLPGRGQKRLHQLVASARAG